MNASQAVKANSFPTISFLFVAHEFYYEDVDHEKEEDCWGFKCPPTEPSEYGELHESRVMRYTDGTITLAEGYEWERRTCTSPGHIFRRRDDGTIAEPTPHDTASVFTCGPPLPVVVVGCDASIEPTFRSNSFPFDLDTQKRTWSLLHFWHPSADLHEAAGLDDGVSRATTRFGNFTRMLAPECIRPFVTAASSMTRSPSWLGPLVPWSFEHPLLENQIGHEGAAGAQHPSRGLGGMLTIVIGMMALAGCGPRTGGDDLVTPMFVPGNGSRGLWHDHTWRGNALRGHLRHNNDTPRGYLVQTFYDDVDNRQWSTVELLSHLQWHTVLVQG